MNASQRLVPAALAAIAVVSAVPTPLAGLDLVGMIDVFGIDGGGTPRSIVAIVAVAALLTVGVLALAGVGTVLAAVGSSAARPVLLVAAIAGIVTATAAWLPAGVLLGVAAHLIANDAPVPAARASRDRPVDPRRAPAPVPAR
jgi:hypothetical protein